MSTFEVTARRVTISEHPDADALEIARVDGYLSVVPKGAYADGDLAVYIPEQAIVPEPILTELGLTGRLAGAEANRVKALRLRGVLSQGLLYRPADRELVEGRDYADELGVTKWVPVVPSDMAGRVYPCPGIEPYTDIENIKRYPDALRPGEPVVAMEKLHGSCLVMSLDVSEGRLHVASKGFALKRLALEDERDPQGLSRNTYWRVVHQHAMTATLIGIARDLGCERLSAYGEVLGVQDLRYGLPKGRLSLRIFDVRRDGVFADTDELEGIAARFGLDLVPVLYRGPYDPAEIARVSRGSEQITGSQGHIREGVVVRPERERDQPGLGRVILKSISPEYLTRNGGTEYE